MVIWKVLLFVKCSDGQALESTARQSAKSMGPRFMLTSKRWYNSCTELEQKDAWQKDAWQIDSWHKDAWQKDA